MAEEGKHKPEEEWEYKFDMDESTNEMFLLHIAEDQGDCIIDHVFKINPAEVIELEEKLRWAHDRILGREFAEMELSNDG